MTLAPGARLGRYEIASQLGSGGMGEVYRARDTQLGRTVAIKVIRSAEGAESDARRRFRREAQIASRLTHPHVCTLFDVGADGDLDYLVLEHLEGTTLADRLKEGALPAVEAIRIATEIADALAFAHGLGFVHRDLKPANVFLTASGAKLLDFGLARAASTVVSSADSRAMTAEGPLTELGAICGTPPYMSPEQAAGRPVDERSDQFSFGSVLFEMLTASRAFPGASAAEALSAVMRDDPLAGPAGRDVPAVLAPVLARLLAKEPSARYPSTGSLAAELHALHRSLESGATSTRRLPSAGGRSRRAWVIAGIAAALAAAAAFAVLRRARPPIDSVAILPFAPRGADAEAALLADGATESLINALAELPSLRVMAMASVARYRGREVDPREVGRALGVGAVLTGHVAPHRDAVTIGVALADARDGRHLWGASYERPSAEILSAQSQLAREVGVELKRRLSGGEEGRLSRPATEDREAYLLFLKGRYSCGLRTRDGLLKGVELFRQALERDPTYARAWAGLAEAYDVLAYSRYLPPRETFEKSREAAAKATELDPSLADAWAVRAHVVMLFEHDLTAAEAAFRKALALSPSCANAHHWYSHLLMQQRRFDESLRESRAALEVDPLSLVMNLHLAEHWLAADDVEAAVRQLRKTVEMDPRFGPAHVVLAAALERSGQRVEALAELEEAVRLLPDSAEVLAQLGAEHARAGRREEAEKVLARLDAMSKERFVSGFSRAAVLAALGDKDRTAAELERALESGDIHAAGLSPSDPRVALLETDPRYRNLLERVRRPDARSAPGR